MKLINSLIQFNINEHFAWGMNQDIKFIKDNFTQATPKQAGVYIMFNQHNHVIYVGKAKILPTRFSAYLEGHSHRPDMEDKISNMRTIFVENDQQAIELEYNLYNKYYLPYFNKTSPETARYLAFNNNLLPTLNEKVLFRRNLMIGYKYFYGPITKAKEANLIIDEILNTFALPRCSNKILLMHRKRKIPCEEYQVGRCDGYCINPIGDKEYIDRIDNINNFLLGKKHNLNKEQTNKLKVTKEFFPIKSDIDSLKINESYDIIYLHRNETGASISVVEVNNGIISDIKNLLLTEANHKGNGISTEFYNEYIKLSDIELIDSFIYKYYSISRKEDYLSNKVIHNPSKIIIINEQLDKKKIENELTKTFGYKIKVTNKLKYTRFLKIIKLNAKLSLIQRNNLLRMNLLN